MYCPHARFHGGQHGYKSYENSGHRAFECIMPNDPFSIQLDKDVVECLNSGDSNAAAARRLQTQAFIYGWLYCCRMKDERARWFESETEKPNT